MVDAKILVVRGRVETSEDWGEFDFLALPSPGDRIMVSREGVANYATVLSVHHHPKIRGSGDRPSAEVVAKWTGSAPRLR